MHLALKRTPASDATRAQREFAALTKWRLCSQYSHGGIVLDGWLYHSTLQHGGLDRERFDMAAASAGWDFVDLGPERDAAMQLLFRLYRGTPYDLFGLLAFVLPGHYDDPQSLYCFEWCALAMGVPLQQRMTPELLLLAATTQPGNRRAFSPPEA